MALSLSTQRASACFLSNESAPRWKYDVFLSFRGVDTRKGFVSHLYDELSKRQGITTFFDDQELERGTSISPELQSAISASHMAIVVLSPNYASSKWCLDELTKIVQCMDVMPIFYDVDPSDVGNQRGSFAKAFAEHEEKFISAEDKKKVTQWRADLREVSKISGWHLKNFKCERELINVEVLNDAEALELFSLHAFRKEQPEEDFLELSKHFLDYARGLPIVLKTLGSSLYARGQDAWNSVRDNLRKIPIPTVFDSLKVSYDGLEKMEKIIFLDVVCFHKGKSKTEVLRKLDNSFGISSSSMIDVLIERSLIYNGYGNGIWMHDLIQEMAWAIVREESEDPGLRSRL